METSKQALEEAAGKSLKICLKKKGLEAREDFILHIY
jgi:hypothetical protein